MNFCILRTAKLKTVGEAIKSARHTFREIPTSNADKDRTHLNKTEGAQSSLGLARAINARLPEKRRKDAVVCIEYLITASPEWWTTAQVKQQNGYINAAMKWLKGRHGEANVVCLNVQLDEKSPHLVAYVVPLTADGRLSASDFLGSPAKMVAMQTEFARDVGAKFGLQRGLEGSKAVHTTAKQYNAAMARNPTLKPPAPLPAPSMAERLTGKAREAEEKHDAEHAKYVAQVERAANEARFNRQARLAQAKKLQELREEVEAAKRHEVEAVRLRAEKKRLEEALQTQRTYFERQIDDLKAQVDKAVDQVKGFLQKIGLLTRERDKAEAEAEELREALYPAEHRSDVRPGSR